jgi:hypothetical protein
MPAVADHHWKSTMYADAVRSAMFAAHACGMTLRDNAAYIQEELPNVSLTPERRVEIEAFCLNAAKHDMLGEIFHIEELLASPSPDSALICSRIEVVISWLWADISRMHVLVESLQADCEVDPVYGLGSLLVTESATNVLDAFNQLKTAFDALCCMSETVEARQRRGT